MTAAALSSTYRKDSVYLLESLNHLVIIIPTQLSNYTFFTNFTIIQYNILCVYSEIVLWKLLL